MRLATLLLVAVFTASAARAQAPGACAAGTGDAILDISDVRASLFNAGNLFFGEDVQAGYIVPEPTGRSPIFAAGIWIGGVVAGDVRVAGSRYDNFEFWPGPLDPGGLLPETDCRRSNANGREAWDRVYVVNVFDVETYEQIGVATADLEDWPVGLGAPAVDAGGDPVVPTSRDQLLDLAAGERPVIYGGETTFWIMNDVGNDHTETNSDPLGVEVQVSAFSIPDAAEAALNQGTFYRYTLVNRNSQPLTETYLSFFVDPDLGDAADDYVGSDTTRGLGFVYNADNNDAVYGTPPAAGVDGLSDGLGAFSYFNSSGPPGTTDPGTVDQYYNFMQGLWGDGTLMTEGGSGYMTDGDITKFAYPGNPVTGAFWSEIDEDNAPGDRRLVAHSPVFTLQPGAARTFDFAVVFAQGANNLDSITRLRAASDLVQDRYDDGSLFDTVAPSKDPPAEAPVLVAPSEGAVFTEGSVFFDWQPVDRATYYILQLDTNPDFSSPEEFTASADSLTLPPSSFPANQPDPFYWRVQGVNASGSGPFSEVRSFFFVLILAAWAGDGDGIVERAYPGIPDVCAGAPADPGCADFGGNTVWHDENASQDYYVSAGGGTGGLDRLSRYIEAAAPDEFEIRFTADGGLAVYAFDVSTLFPIARVPFELWNVGRADDGENDPADDVRMIPFLNNPAGEYQTDWADAFTGSDPWFGSPCAGGCNITDWVYGMMPDRPNGYARFEEASLGFGGPGALYDPAADGDTRLDLDPLTNEPCENQGVYVDYCYRNQVFVNNGPSTFIYLFGRLVFADLAQDGTTPPAGTAVRLITTNPSPVANEPGTPEALASYALLPAYPNPFRSRAVVAYAAPRPGRLRVAVYDLLGREVAVLADGMHPAGRYEAVLDGARLASGVYAVVLEADGVQASRRVTLVR